MKRESDRVFDAPTVDGIDFLSRRPGIYCIENRINGKRYVGLATVDVHWRCVLHRTELRKGTSANMFMRRDVAIHGADAFFFFALHVADSYDRVKPSDLEGAELWFMIQFRSHDERYGYNLEGIHQRTRAARFRDRERKLMRGNSKKYSLLPGIDIYEPIHRDLLGSWVQGG